MGNNSKTIAIQDIFGTARKITKIVCHSKGGFAVFVPYHRARSGLLMKLPADYGVKGVYGVPFAECMGFSADDRVKLSFHPDGFVQFSGENTAKILSGRNLGTGEPKGLGLVSNPLSHPIRTGPTFGVSAWGIHEFDELEADHRDALVFSPEEMYYRCTPGMGNGIHIEGFLFEPRYWSGVRGKPGDFKLTLCVGMFEATGSALELKVIPLRDCDTFIGLLASHVRFGFPEPSGFTLSGPSKARKTRKKTSLWRCTLPPSGGKSRKSSRASVI